MRMARGTIAAALALTCAAPPDDRAEARPAAVPASSGGGGGGASALAGYDFAAAPAARWELPRRLREVSGLAATEDGRIFAHDDERGLIHELDPRDGVLVKSFALVDGGSGADGGEQRPLRGDFEGLVAAGGRFYLVTSDGVLYESGEGRADERVTARALRTGLGARCEIEGLGYEPDGRVLLLACKTAREGVRADAVTIFRWSLAAGALDAARPSLVVPVAELARAGGPPRAFSASGIERDPRTGNYILVAARQRALAEVTPSGTVVAALRLPAARHPQAEGIALTPDGTLLIADEGEESGAGTVAVYRRK